MLDAEQRRQDMQATFRTIFLENRWAHPETVSGPGSATWPTGVIRHLLPALIRVLRARSLLDAPCGDFHWMRHVPLDIDYLGCDIVPEIVAQNRGQYGRPDRRFVQLDLVHDAVPRADIILCRDLNGHLAFTDVFAVLGNFARSQSTYLLTTTFPVLNRNEDLTATGGWRPLNLEKPPFSLPRPLMAFREVNVEDPRYPDKSLGLWALSELPLRGEAYPRPRPGES